MRYTLTKKGEAMKKDLTSLNLEIKLIGEVFASIIKIL
jgi:hypothetical protein